jgi:hypothetical protein
MTKTLNKSRVEEFIRAGVDAIVTASPLCLSSLREGGRGKPVAIDGVSTLLAIGIGID